MGNNNNNNNNRAARGKMGHWAWGRSPGKLHLNCSSELDSSLDSQDRMGRWRHCTQRRCRRRVEEGRPRDRGRLRQWPSQPLCRPPPDLGIVKRAALLPPSGLAIKSAPTTTTCSPLSPPPQARRTRPLCLRRPRLRNALTCGPLLRTALLMPQPPAFSSASAVRGCAAPQVRRSPGPAIETLAVPCHARKHHAARLTCPPAAW
jgi:hypothetical protein